MLDLHQNPQLVRKGVLHIRRLCCTTFERGIKTIFPFVPFPAEFLDHARNP